MQKLLTEVSRLHCSKQHSWEFPQGPHVHMHYSFPGTFTTLPNTRPHTGYLFTLTQRIISLWLSLNSQNQLLWM